jgi:chemotaxis protein methyltransferase CheR
VCKRLRRRTRALGMADLESYRAQLLDHPQEWRVLDAMCRATISRFYSDRGVYEAQPLWSL